MATCVTELEGILQSMLELKPPGAAGQKIQSVTSLCNANVQAETALIGKLYTHFKKAPANYKLGVLYVVDSVARSWLDQAKKAGQELGSSAADGTFAAGIHHITELLPALMSDITTSAPQEQKVKIEKLISIWERGSTFPASILTSFRQKLTASNGNAQTTTPDGSPPAQALNAIVPNGNAAQNASLVQAPTNLADTLKALAGMAPQSSTPSNISAPQNSMLQNMPVNQQPMQFPQIGGQQQQQQAQQQGLNGLFANPALASLFAAQQPQQQQQQQAFPQQQPAMPGMNNDAMKQLAILAQLQQMGIPQDKWAALLPAMMNMPQNQVPAPAQKEYPLIGEASRDYAMRSQEVNRGRSRSPPWGSNNRDRSPPRRRDSPVYSYYGNREREDGQRGRGGRDGGRRRSPDRFRRSDSPRRDEGEKYPLPEPGPKRLEFDPTIGEGNIKVHSRTLFVGGVTCTEDELRPIFASFGRVQTCIVNLDKRHAFVKMITREEALAAKEGMENYRNPDMQLRTRWGVGFGPRDCSNYQTGVSIIPIQRLTDADRKWLLSAEFGGTGGKPIESGLVIEEPDIEIGAGVSSKAISRRMQTDKSGTQGPRSSRDGQGRFRDRRDDDNPNNIGVGTAPAVPNFGFNFPMMQNGSPMPFPPGFIMPEVNGQNGPAGAA